MTRYRWIDSQKAAGFPVRVACRVAEVSSSAYYDYWPETGLGPEGGGLGRSPPGQ